MRHTYIIALLLIVCSTASAQVYQRMPQYGYQMPRAIMDSVLQPPTDTVRNKTGLARIGTQLYAGNGTFWSAATFDTAGIRYRPTAGSGISITGTYPSQTIAGNPDTLVAGANITLTASGTKKVTISANTASLDSLYGGKLDSVRLRGSTLREFAAGDSTLVGVISGGGGGGTLQQAFDADPAAVPQINAGENYFEIKADYDGTNKLMIGGGEGVTLSVDNTSFNIASSLKVTADGLFDIRSTQSGSDHAITGFPGRIEIVGLPDTSITRIGIGTQSPTVGLDVGVDAKFRKNGTPGSGKVPTGTDADGNWTWQTPASGGITTTQLTDSLNNREPRYKFRDDSTGNAGYTTLYQRNKLKDSLQANIDLKANTADPTFTGSIALSSTTGGITLPSVTQTQMNAIVPALGTQVFNTTYNAVCTYVDGWGWWTTDPAWLTYNGWDSRNEFIATGNSATTTHMGDFYAQIANSGTVTSSAGTANRPGIIQLSTASSGTARASLISDIINTQTLSIGGGRLMYEAEVRIDTLSSASQTFRFFTGLSNNNQVVSASSIAFLYDSTGANTGSAAIGRWQVVCSNGTTRSYKTTDSTVTAGQWYRLRAVINAAGNSVDFYINGAWVWTETNTIPTAAMSPMAVLTKSNGTTARTVFVDFIRMRQKFTTAR